MMFRRLILMGVLALPAMAQSPWRAGCVLGPPSFPMGDCTIRLDGGQMFVEGRRIKNFQISATSIVAISHITENAKNSEIFLQPDSSSSLSDFAGCGAAGDAGCGGLAVVLIAAGLIMSLPAGPNHYVTVRWEDRGARQEIVMEFDEKDYRDFLKHLWQASGKPWQTLTPEQTQLMTTLRRERGHAVEVTLERPTLVGAVRLSPGPYQVLAVPTKGDSALLCFFRDPIESGNLMAAVAARAGPALPEVPANPLEFTPAGDRIVGFHTAENQFSVK